MNWKNYDNSNPKTRGKPLSKATKENLLREYDIIMRKSKQVLVMGQ